MKFWLILLLFVASGFSSLIYQVVWTRMLVFVFGSTTFATATVLSVFMGGLALGSFLTGRKADKIRRPFFCYGILEGVIGVWALLAPFLFEFATPLYRVIWQGFHLAPVPFGILRFFVALSILLVPTTCMGATLPLLAKFVTDKLESVGRRIGMLYAANTLGAVAGAGVAGLCLLPLYGLSKSTLIGAAINFVLIGIVVLVSKRWEGLAGPVEAGKEGVAVPKHASGELTEVGTPVGEATSDREASADAAAGAPGSSSAATVSSTAMSLQTKAVIISFAISGAVAMIYEVAWTRTLLMVIGSSTYAFTIMLTTFLLGIFLGSLCCARYIDKSKDPVLWFGLIQVGVALASFVSLERFNSLPLWNLQLNEHFASDPAMAMSVRFLIASAIMMPLTFFLGAVFPAAVKACVRDLSAVGRSVAALYSANTLGAIVGSFLCGFVLIPLIGVEKSLIAGTAVNMLVGVYLLTFGQIKRTLKIAVLLAGVGASAYWLMRPEVWYRDLIIYAQNARRKIATMPKFDSPLAFHQWLEKYTDVPFYVEGASSTVAIMKSTKVDHTSLVTNGHVDASTGKDMTQQVLLGYLPILLHREPKEVAVVGWGSGVTVGAACQASPDAKVTAIELEPAVVKASKYFSLVNHEPEKNPRVKIEFNDGRNFMLATDKKFDVIISEPSNPWQAGVCNLFTREYFQLCKQRLLPNGLFAMWCQIVEIPSDNLRQILAAVAEVYPQVSVMFLDEGNIFVVGSNDPFKFDWEKLRKSIPSPETQADLNRVGCPRPETVLSKIGVPPEGLGDLVKGVEPNNDDTNRLEFDVGRIYESTDSFSRNKDMLLGRSFGDVTKLVDWKNSSAEEIAAVMCQVAVDCRRMDRRPLAQTWIDASLKVKPTVDGYRLAGINWFQQGKFSQCWKAFEDGLKLNPNSVRLIATRGEVRLDANKPVEAREDFNRVLAINPANRDAALGLAKSYSPYLVLDVQVNPPAATENPELALKFVTPLLADEEFLKLKPFTLWVAAWSSYKLNRFEDAEKYARKFVALDRRFPAGLQLLSAVLYARGNYIESSACMQRFKEVCRDGLTPLIGRATKMVGEGRNEEAFRDTKVLLTILAGSTQGLDLLEDLSFKDKQVKAYYDEYDKLWTLLN